MRDRNYAYGREDVADWLRKQGLPELADRALHELPDPADVNQIEAWAMQYGVTMSGLISRMGGSP